MDDFETFEVDEIDESVIKEIKSEIEEEEKELLISVYIGFAILIIGLLAIMIFVLVYPHSAWMSQCNHFTLKIGNQTISRHIS